VKNNAEIINAYKSDGKLSLINIVSIKTKIPKVNISTVIRSKKKFFCFLIFVLQFGHSKQYFVSELDLLINNCQVPPRC
jgi:hypothetical protein